MSGAEQTDPSPLKFANYGGSKPATLLCRPAALRDRQYPGAADNRAAAPFRRELRLLALLRLPLSQPHPGAAAVLVDELDAGPL